ncbi:MAG TPA: DUF6600 domain-containing protein [Acetobacteraceae bacterium]|nr:DUF6600 domain-containing protein [Acetobacteraceae bacterium]
MITNRLLTSLPVALAMVGLVLGPALPAVAVAQQPPAAPAQPAAGDPPARVGWLTQLSGTVSFHASGQNQWVPATPNYPVSTGDAVWTQPNSGASVIVDASRVALAGTTELDVTQLDTQTMSATLSQGEAYLQVRDLQQGQSFVIQTPRGTAQIATPGRYEINAGDTSTPTTITVLDGAVQWSAPNTVLQVAAGQTAVLQGQDPVTASIGPAQNDAFLAQMVAQAAPPPAPAAVALPPVVQQMTGAAYLTNYGSWQDTPQYGTVWYPRVASGWVPYRQGHWAYVAPWGWTWCDDQPWGFAPFHYGRWVDYGGRWGWAPIQPGISIGIGVPVYAPALVSFIGIGVAIGITANVFDRGSVGWVPLGLNEPYYPPYRVSPRYIRNVNIINVRNINVVKNITVVNNRTTIINRNVTINNFANRRGATVVPAAAFVGSRRIGAVAKPIPRAQFATLHAVAGVPVQPTRATVGVTHALAQRMKLAPAPAGVKVPARKPAPGPAIRPAVLHGGPAGLPRLVPHGAAAVRPAQPGVKPGLPGVRPGLPGVKPGQPGVKPGQPGVKPGQPGVRPVQPGVGVKPALPGVKPGLPGVRPVQPAVKPGLPKLGVPPHPPVIGQAPRPAPTQGAKPAVRPGQVPHPPVAPTTRPQLQVPHAPGVPPHPPVIGQTPHPAPVQRPAAPVVPRVQPPRPPVRQAPRPPVQQAPRPAVVPHVQPPRPPVQAPRPPVQQAPRPAIVPHVQPPRPPVQQAPRPPVQAPRPAPRSAPPPRYVPPAKPPQQQSAYHPPAYHPPAYHPPVYHPPVYHPPVYHPPVQQVQHVQPRPQPPRPQMHAVQPVPKKPPFG